MNCIAQSVRSMLSPSRCANGLLPTGKANWARSEMAKKPIEVEALAHCEAKRLAKPILTATASKTDGAPALEFSNN